MPSRPRNGRTLAHRSPSASSTPDRVRHLLRAPCTLILIVIVCVMFVASHLSGIWSGNVTNLQRVLDFNYQDLGHGQWWRIVTPNLTNGPLRHDFGPAGLPHLLGNVVGLL